METVLVSLIGFTLVYGFLAVIEMKLLVRYVKAGPHAVMPIGHDESPDQRDDDAGRASESSEGDTLAFALLKDSRWNSTLCGSC